jgi:hypothetical protein
MLLRVELQIQIYLRKSRQPEETAKENLRFSTNKLDNNDGNTLRMRSILQNIFSRKLSSTTKSEYCVCKMGEKKSFDFFTGQKSFAFSFEIIII